MKSIWNTIQLVFSGIGGYVGYFMGGRDGFLYALTISRVYWLRFLKSAFPVKSALRESVEKCLFSC